MICANSDVGLNFGDNPEECEAFGTRHECETVPKTVCNPIQVTKYRKEIDQNCTTMTDKTCKVVYTQVPKEKCEASEEEKCFTEYKVVEEQAYKEECHTEVENICEKEIAVPEEFDVRASPPPNGHLHQTPLPPTKTTASDQLDHLKDQAQNKSETMFPPQPALNQLKSYNATPSPIGEFVTRKKRDVVKDDMASQNEEFEALLNQSTLPKPLLSLFEPKSEESGTQHLHSGPVKVPLKTDHNGPVGEPLNADGAPFVTEESTEELPAPPGCRSIATTTCQKVPYKKSTKVPFETCELVPSVKCRLVLKEVAELSCTPEVYEYCENFVKEVPYLVAEEECEEVLDEECYEVMVSNCPVISYQLTETRQR